MKTNQTCAELVGEYFRSRMDDIRELWLVDCGRVNETGRFARLLFDTNCGYVDHEKMVNQISNAIDGELGTWGEYGLSLDLHLPDDGMGIPAHLAFVLSTGGPHEEFRFFISPKAGGGWAACRIEFWLLDWFDGASWDVSGGDLTLLREIFDSWDECGVIESKLEEAHA